MKIVTVIGARPQFIKAAVVSHALVQIGLEESILHTGQHFDANMSDVFFAELELPSPVCNLGIGGGTHGQNTGRMLESIESKLIESKPGMVLVYGDTDSTLAAALAAVKLQIPVAHVEAGLRSFNRGMPEEINRILTDHAAAILFAPTELAARQLRKEGIVDDMVRLVGDVMYDAALHYGGIADRTSGILRRLELESKGFTLATIHRAENTDHRQHLSAILAGFAGYGRTIVLPLHPRTRSRLMAYGLSVPENVRIIDPVGYLDMVMLEKHARLIATDSGGVQKEAFFHRVPCVTLRRETEWVELVDAGWNRLAPPDSGERIAAAMTDASGRVGQDISPYGAGNAAELIARCLKEQTFQCHQDDS